MTVYFTSQEIQEITKLHDQGVAANNRSAMYLGIASILQSKLAGASAADRASLDQVILWLQGASQANSGQGIYSTLIRTYTQMQAQLRGVNVDLDTMQLASNNVGDAVFSSITNAIVNPNYAVPTIDTIANDDAVQVGQTIFQSIPNDSALTQNAGWSGAVLFSLLGSDQTYRLLKNGTSVQPGLQNLDDARNVLFAVYSLSQALQKAWSQGEGEAVQYFNSLSAGGGSGPLATDLSIAFNTLTSSNNFVGPAEQFFQHTGLASAVAEFASLGLNNVLDFFRSSIAGQIVTGTTDQTFTANAYSLFSSLPGALSSYNVSLPSVSTLLSEALTTGSANDAAREALVALSPIVISGLPSSGNDLSLWQPGTTSGLTPDYLRARAEMLQAELNYDAYGSTDSPDSAAVVNNRAYYDLSVSSNPLYTETGLFNESITDKVMFAGAGPETLTGGNGDDELFGGSGSDVLDGGSGFNLLEGGSGSDTFVVDDGSDGNDTILSMSGTGEVLFQGDNASESLTGGSQVNDDTWISSDGKITYTMGTSSDGTSALTIAGLGQSAEIKDFTNGELGISLTSANAQTTSNGPSNLTSLDTITPGGGGDPYYYGDDGKNGTEIISDIYGVNTTGKEGNFIDGFHNASYIYAGDGDNTVSAENINLDPSTGGYDNGTASNLTIEGGAGNQMLYGIPDGNETIQGGNSTVSTYFTEIFGGLSGTANLSLGTEDGIIFGGTGTDTLNAGNAQFQNGLDAVLFAGISDPQVGNNPSVSLPGGLNDSFQIDVDGSAYLGSSLDSGSAGSTTLPGSLLIGGAGDDYLIGNAGNDTLVGGTATVVSPWQPWYVPNTTVPTYDEVLLGGAGNNLIIAGNGDDAIFADMSPAISNWADLDPSNSDTVYGGAGQDLVYGSGGNNYFYAGTGDFQVHLGNGNNSVYGSSGSLAVIGGSGNDYIVGGSGKNELAGGAGNDTILGGSGDSTIFGLGGSDYINAGSGDDLIFANTSAGMDANWANAGSGSSVTIEGGTGNDTIYGSGGANLIGAGTGDDVIQLGSGASTVDAGSGSDTFYAGSGNELFQLSDNGQTDYVSGGSSASSVVLDFQNTAPYDVSFSNDGSGDLVISYGGSTLTLIGYVANNESNVSLTFEDGTTLGAAQISLALQQTGGDIQWGGNGSPDTIYASDGNETIGNLTGSNVVDGGDGYDTIYGGTGADTIESGSGGASIVGGTGSETYVFNAGDGSEVITENQSTLGSDILELGASVSESDISFTQQGNNLVMLVDGGAVGSVEIVNYFASSSGSVHTVGSIQFSDGTALNQADVTADLVYNNDGVITGDSGANVYRFDVFSGVNSITQDNVGSTNTIDFTDGIVSSDIIARRDMSDDLVLTDTLDGVSVTVENYFTANNGGIDTNFTVNFSDGSSWNAQQILTATMTPSGGLDTLWGSDGNDSITAGAGNTLIIATTGNNTLTGGAGIDTLDGGSGADTLEAGAGAAQINGGTGSETYVYNFGDGSSTITESTLSSGQDTLVMGGGIALTDLTFSEVGGQELVIGITDPSTDTQQSVTIDNFFGLDPSSNHAIAALDLADGSTLSAGDIESLISSYSGNGGNQYITGTTSNGSYYAGNGDNVTVQGGPGNDLIVGGSGTDTLFGGTGNNTIDAGSGDDLIQGGTGNDLVNLGNGNATVIASDGNDTYDWNGTGNQVIDGYGAYYDQATGGLDYNTKQSFGYALNPDDNSGTKTGQDVLHISGGITANELTYQLASQGGSAVTIGIAGTTASLTLTDISTPDVDGQYGLTGIQLDDGQTISRSQILQYAVEASESQNNSLIWLPAAISFSEQGSGDTLNADGGNDTIALTGGSQTINVAGTNTVEFGRGSGNDTIYGLNSNNDENLNGQLTVQLAQGVRPQDIRITAERDASGNDPAYYVISIAGSSDQLTVAAGAVGSGSNPENLILQFSDGTTWNATQIQAYASQSLDQGNIVSFGYGSGDETQIYDGGLSGSIIQMQADIAPSDVTVTYQGNNQYALSLPGGTDELILSPSALSYVQFADGTTWQITDVEKLAMQPQAAGNQQIVDAIGGNNVLTAEGNGDTLQGGSGNDTLDPGTGNTVMVAGTGSTTFLYNLGDGNDTIQSAGDIPNGVLQLGAGITEDDVALSEKTITTVYGSTSNLVLTILSTGKTIDLQNYVPIGNGGVYQPSTALTVEFSDGTLLGGPQTSVSSLSDSVGGQILLGSSGSETLTSSAGYDTIYGGAGNEEIDAGTGHDVIYQGSGSELIQAGSGSDTVYEANNGSSGGPITIDGGAGDNLIYGYGDNGGLVSTTLLFGTGSGQDTLFDVQNLTIQFAQGISQSDLSVKEFYVDELPVGQLISVIGTSDSIYLPGGWATLAFSDGSTASSITLATDVSVQPSSTTLTSYTYQPSSSSDPAASSGDDEIANYDHSGFTLTFGSDAYGNPITSTNINVKEDGANIEIGGVTLDNFYQATEESDGSYSYTPANVTVQFADGVSWNTADIQQAIFAQAYNQYAPAWLTQYGGQTYTQAAGPSYIQEENAGGNLITSSGSAGLGVTLIGTASNDTIDWGLGTNHATTVQGFGSTDVVNFDSAVLPGNLMGMVVNGTNLELYDASSGETLVIDGYFNQGADTNEGGTFEFADGLTVTNAQLEALLSASSTYVPVINAYLPITSADSSTTGTQGNDTIVAGPGSETISGGGGNDQLYAGSGADTFVFGHGSGHDTLHGSAQSGVINTLQFSSDVDPSDVSVYSTGPNGTLVLALKDSGETVTLPDYLAQSANQVIQQVTFSDGTTWSVSTLASLATQPSPYNQYIQASTTNASIVAGTGNDTLVSSDGTDTLTAGAGADTLYGGAGTDVLVAGSGSASLIGGSGTETYQFAPGFGSDTVVADNAVSSTIQFTGGIVASDVTVSTEGQNLTLNVQGGGSILLPNALVWGGVGQVAIDYADGSSTTLGALIQALPNYQAATSGNESLVANSGSDTLVADGGNDTLVATSGNDTLVAGSGSDLLEAGTGNDLVLGNTGTFTFQVGTGAGEDTLDASAPTSGANTIALTNDVTDLVFSRPVVPSTSGDSGAALYIEANDANGWTSSITLDNHYVDGVATNDVGDIQFSDGSTLSLAQVDQWLNEAAAQPSTSVEVVGSGNENVTVGTYTSLVVVGNGDDTLQMSASGNATLLGGSGNDEFIAGGGNESIQAGSGEDTFTFASGSGQDTLSADWSSTDDTIAFTGTTAVGNLVFSLSGNNLLITQEGSVGADSQASAITLSDYNEGGTLANDSGEIAFANGPSVSMATINQLLIQSDGQPVQYLPSTVLTAPASGDSTLTSDDGHDTLIGSSSGGSTTMFGGTGTDVMEAGTGANEMEGGAGQETYQFGPDVGSTTIDTSAYEQHSGTIQFTGGITASDVTYSQDYSNDALQLNVTSPDGSSSTITIDNHYLFGIEASTFDIGDIEFSDGTSISMTQADELATSGNDTQSATLQTAPSTGDDTLTSDGSNDTLVGSSGPGTTTMNGGFWADLMIAGSGANIMNGAIGAETYEFNEGFGQTTINTEGNYESYSNTIEFGAGITASDLSYAQNGSDLVITVGEPNGSTGAITVAGHFASGSPSTTDIGDLAFADGSIVTMATINNLFSESFTDQAVASAAKRKIISPTSSTSTSTKSETEQGDRSATSSTTAPSHVVSSSTSSASLMATSTVLKDMAATLESAPTIGDVTTVRTTLDSASTQGDVSKQFEDFSQLLAREKRASPSFAVTGSPLKHATTDTASATSASYMAPSQVDTSAQSTALSGRTWNSTAVSLDSHIPDDGAPVDPVDGDMDDIEASGQVGANNAGPGQSTGGTSAASTARMEQAFPTPSQGRGVRLGRTASAANDMIKALSAQGGMQALQGQGKSSQIQLQDGTLWSLSSLDRTMAAWTSVESGRGAQLARGASSFGSADLAHVQLIDAMASFSPQAAAESGLPPADSEAYAIALAAQTH